MLPSANDRCHLAGLGRIGPNIGKIATLAILLLLAVPMTSCSWLGGSPDTTAGIPSMHDTISENSYREQGIASWYGKEFHQRPTATGEVYDMYAMTAAHRTLPLGTSVVVTALDTNRTVHVRINDRGPFVEDRIIDLSYGAAKELGILQKGTTRVEIRCSFTEDTLRDQLGYWVQLGAYEDRDRAGELALSLEEEYKNVRVLSSSSYHHVRIGPFRSEPEATRLKELLHEKGLSAFVVRDLLSLSD
jgi:rare lipoprotein A